ncbi:hypothetical protein Lal_00043083 [Lupinus albus]|nr:hypothetical protein Lal_00043083 [Lupinus albus]
MRHDSNNEHMVISTVGLIDGSNLATIYNNEVFPLVGGSRAVKEPKQMKSKWLFLMIAPCDAAEPWQLGFQDAATPMMQGIIDFHHDIFFFLILILVFVSRILVRALWHFRYKKNPIPQRIVHGTTIEILRTIFPSIIPMFIVIPSFALLYSMDEVVVDPAITIKAIGHQWYRGRCLNLAGRVWKHEFELRHQCGLNSLMAKFGRCLNSLLAEFWKTLLSTSTCPCPS